MRVLPSLGLALAFFVSAGLPGASVAEQTAPISLLAITELKSGHNGHFIVDADINGSTIKVLVDTGASAVALSYEDAKRAGLRPNTLDYNIPVGTANGQAMAARVKLRSVSIDSVRVDNVEGFVMPEGALQGTLLGMSFLSKLSSFRVEDGVLVLKN